MRSHESSCVEPRTTVSDQRKDVAPELADVEQNTEEDAESLYPVRSPLQLQLSLLEIDSCLNTFCLRYAGPSLASTSNIGSNGGGSSSCSVASSSHMYPWSSSGIAGASMRTPRSNALTPMSMTTDATTPHYHQLSNPAMSTMNRSNNSSQHDLNALENNSPYYMGLVGEDSSSMQRSVSNLSDENLYGLSMAVEGGSSTSKSNPNEVLPSTRRRRTNSLFGDYFANSTILKNNDTNGTSNANAIADADGPDIKVDDDRANTTKTSHKGNNSCNNSNPDRSYNFRSSRSRNKDDTCQEVGTVANGSNSNSNSNSGGKKKKRIRSSISTTTNINNTTDSSSSSSKAKRSRVTNFDVLNNIPTPTSTTTTTTTTTSFVNNNAGRSSRSRSRGLAQSNPKREDDTTEIDEEDAANEEEEEEDDDDDDDDDANTAHTMSTTTTTTTLKRNDRKAERVHDDKILRLGMLAQFNSKYGNGETNLNGDVAYRNNNHGTSTSSNIESYKLGPQGTRTLLVEFAKSLEKFKDDLFVIELRDRDERVDYEMLSQTLKDYRSKRVNNTSSSCNNFGVTSSSSSSSVSSSSNPAASTSDSPSSRVDVASSTVTSTKSTTATTDTINTQISSDNSNNNNNSNSNVDNLSDRFAWLKLPTASGLLECLSHSSTRAGIDPDPIVSCPIVDSRHVFLEMCMYRNFQFDTLRRAKHSSLQLLYHLRNPHAKHTRLHCTECSRLITKGEVRWHCDMCSGFDVCQDCAEIEKDLPEDFPLQLLQPSNTQIHAAMTVGGGAVSGALNMVQHCTRYTCPCFHLLTPWPVSFS